MIVRRFGIHPGYISLLQLKLMVNFIYSSSSFDTNLLWTEIITISKSTWSKSMAFTNEDCIGATTALALSVNGAYLASACSAGIFVWSTASRKVVGRFVVFSVINFKAISAYSLSAI